MWATCQIKYHMMEDDMKGYDMKGYEDFQKTGQENFDNAVKNFEEVNKGVQAIASEVTDYTKKAIEDSSVAFEKLMGVKSVEQVIEIQTGYAKKAYDDYVSQASKLGEMYVTLAKEAYKPVEKALAKKV